MSILEAIGEGVACASFLVVLVGLLFFGSAISPYEGSMHNESTFNQELGE